MYSFHAKVEPNFYFLFRNNVLREQLDANDILPCYGNFFWKCHSESAWSQFCSKFFLNNYEAQTWFLNLTWCWSNNLCHSLFTFLPFDILCILKFIQYLYAFFISASKIFMRLSVVFCEGVQPQSLIFLFSVKQYLLTAKTTDINNSPKFLHGVKEQL